MHQANAKILRRPNLIGTPQDDSSEGFLGIPLNLWRETEPDAPEGPWYKDFGSFKICGEGKFPKTFLLAGQPAKGKRL